MAPFWEKITKILDLVAPVKPGAVGPEDHAGWVQLLQEDGTVTFRLDSWAKYFDFLEAEIFAPSAPHKHKYIWRGQRRSDWSLSSSLDRLFGKLDLLTANPTKLQEMSSDHLASFSYATRGRRGINPPHLLENDWWALGQHFGLATPLLDWTRSPFAAAYFAFEESASNSESTEYRSVYALDIDAVKKRTHELEGGTEYGVGQSPGIVFIDSMSDENPRLVSQGGLFTRSPIGVPVDHWVSRAFEGLSVPILIKIEIPDSDRLMCLRALSRMNINHLSLFPDLIGASRSTNLKLELEL